MATTVDSVIERGFLLAESQAMKAKLSNIYVRDKNAPGGRKRVYVRYGYPDAEADRKYPMITIDLVDIEPAYDRMHSLQMVPIDYWPSEYATFAEYADAHGISYDPETHRAEAAWWVPHNLTFQISTYARDPQQDLEMQSVLAGTAFLPSRFGFLHVPADGSQRWLDRQDWRVTNYDEGEGGNTLRIHRKTIRVVVTADLPPELPIIFSQVVELNGAIIETNTDTAIDDWEHTAPVSP